MPKLVHQNEIQIFDKASETEISNLFTTSRTASLQSQFSRCVCLRPNGDKLNKANEEQTEKKTTQV